MALIPTQYQLHALTQELSSRRAPPRAEDMELSWIRALEGELELGALRLR